LNRRWQRERRVGNREVLALLWGRSPPRRPTPRVFEQKVAKVTKGWETGGFLGPATCRSRAWRTTAATRRYQIAMPATKILISFVTFASFCSNSPCFIRRESARAWGCPGQRRNPIRSEELPRPRRDGRPSHRRVWPPRKCSSRPRTQGSS